VQHTATQCNTLHDNPNRLQTHYNTLQHTAWPSRQITDTMKHTATQCNTPQHAATRCNTLQHTATQYNTMHDHPDRLQTHRNTLQHSAILCNTLQHSAILCNTLHDHPDKLQLWKVQHDAHDMGRLRLVGSLQLYVSFAKEPYKRDYILHKRLVILKSLLIVATPYQWHEWVMSTRCRASYKRYVCVMCVSGVSHVCVMCHICVSHVCVCVCVSYVTVPYVDIHMLTLMWHTTHTYVTHDTHT